MPAGNTAFFGQRTIAAQCVQKPEAVSGYCLQGAYGGSIQLFLPAARPQAERRTLQIFLSLYAASPQRQCLLQASVTLPKKEQPFAALFYPEIKRIPRPLFLNIPFINPYNKHREFPCNIKIAAGWSVTSTPSPAIRCRDTLKQSHQGHCDQVSLYIPSGMSATIF